MVQLYDAYSPASFADLLAQTDMSKYGYAGKERLENKELMRAIKTDTMNSLLGGKNVQSKVMANTYPDAPLLFKEKVFLEMLGLPLEYKESKLRKEIIAHMKTLS